MEYHTQPAAEIALIDIGLNLTDPMFQGEYRGKMKHAADLVDVLQRARDNGVIAAIVTGGNLDESRKALEMASEHDMLFATVGCHPTRAKEFDDSGSPEQYYKHLSELISKGAGKVVAIGECGLDYDRLNFCDKETQQKYFERQFGLAEETGLPMFLHNRNTGGDFVAAMRKNRSRIVGGVVHSFTGSLEEATDLVGLGLYIGINGCSLKTEENLAVVRSLPTECLMLETDAPWCDVRPTHAGYKYVKSKFTTVKAEKFKVGCMVKNRNEPACMRQILEVVAGVRGVSESELAAAVLHNTNSLFQLPQ